MFKNNNRKITMMVVKFPTHLYYSPFEIKVNFECSCSYKTKLVVNEKDKKLPSHVGCKMCNKKYSLYMNVETPKGYVSVETMNEQDELSINKKH